MATPRTTTTRSKSLAFCAIMIALAGCSGAHEPDDAEAPFDAPDAAADGDASDSATVDAADPSLRVPPKRPTTADDDLGTEVLFAIRDLDLDPGEAWATAGYDLDQLWSQGESPDVECVPPARSGELAIDGAGGVDNVFGRNVVPLLVLDHPELEPDARTMLSRGFGTVLLQLRGWNGTADDARIEVTFAQSAFAIPSNAAGSAPVVAPPGIFTFDADGYLDLPPPAWDGRDFWYARDDAFLDGDPTMPRIVDDNAYVAGGVIVMRVPDRFPIGFVPPGGTGWSVRLTEGVITARLSPSFDAIDEVILAGRWLLLDVLESASIGAGICMGTERFAQLSRVLDLSADIRATPGTGGPDRRCDAVSVGLRFEGGIRGNFGGVVASPYAWTNPCD